MRGLCQKQISQAKAQSLHKEFSLLFNMTISQTQSDILCASFFKTTDKMTNLTMDTDCMADTLYKTWPEPHDARNQILLR